MTWDMPIFNGLWIGEITDLCRLSINSYLANGHEYRLWTYDDIDIPGVTICDANNIVERSVYHKWANCSRPHKWQTFANYFRFKLILEYGGWWADLDSVAVRHHDFEDDYVFSSIETPTREQLKSVTNHPYGNIPNGCFRSPKGAPYLGELVSKLENEGFMDGNCPDFAIWGVVAFSKAIYTHGLDKYKQEKAIFCPFPPSSIDSLYSKRLVIPDWAYSVHFYNWMSKERSGGLFKELYDRYVG